MPMAAYARVYTIRSESLFYGFHPQMSRVPV